MMGSTKADLMAEHFWREIDSVLKTVATRTTDSTKADLMAEHFWRESNSVLKTVVTRDPTRVETTAQTMDRY